MLDADPRISTTARKDGKGEQQHLPHLPTPPDYPRQSRYSDERDIMFDYMV
jgi:hypothetical protein